MRVLQAPRGPTPRSHPLDVATAATSTNWKPPKISVMIGKHETVRPASDLHPRVFPGECFC